MIWNEDTGKTLVGGSKGRGKKMNKTL